MHLPCLHLLAVVPSAWWSSISTLSHFVVLYSPSSCCWPVATSRPTWDQVRNTFVSGPSISALASRSYLTSLATTGWTSWQYRRLGLPPTLLLQSRTTSLQSAMPPYTYIVNSRWKAQSEVAVVVRNYPFLTGLAQSATFELQLVRITSTKSQSVIVGNIAH